ncbi:type II secretion system F family protein [Candidatus Babeliales bacterium]|nr:type II secretion system F family protein [Candidatus Babeliales bacterium]
MPLFQYDSYTRRGKRVKGTIDAVSAVAAKEILKGQGLMPVSIVHIGVEKKKSWYLMLFERKVDVKIKIIFTKQLSVLLRSGVPLLEALELLIEQFEKRFKRILIDVRDGVKGGESFASQLNKYPRVFSNVYVQLVKAGEATGKLHSILERLIGYLEKEEKTRRRVRKAMAYPIFMITFSLVVVIALLTFLVPRVTEMFVKMGRELPGPTRFLKNISDFVLNNYVILYVILAAVVAAFSYWRATKSGRYKLDEIFLKLPLISYFSRTKAVVQFSKTLGLLLESGVNLSEALEIVCNIVENQVLVKKLREAKTKIIKEGKLAMYLKETGIFPNIAIYMIRTGEESGNLDQMLLTVGNDYDVQLADITDSLVSKIGPVMTIIVGIIIVFIVISVLLPFIEFELPF